MITDQLKNMQQDCPEKMMCLSGLHQSYGNGVFVRNTLHGMDFFTAMHGSSLIKKVN